MDKMTFMKNWVARQSAIPTKGLVFYAPLDTETLTPVVGNTMTLYGTDTFPPIETVEGIKCFRSNNGVYMTAPCQLKASAQPAKITISVWARQAVPLTIWKGANLVAGVMYNDVYSSVGVTHDNSNPNNTMRVQVIVSGVPNRTQYIDFDSSKFNHIAVTADIQAGTSSIGQSIFNTWSIYVNGVLRGQWENFTAPKFFGGINRVQIGTTTNRADEQFYIAAFRVYNHILTDQEITSLANEFHLTPSVGGVNA